MEPKSQAYLEFLKGKIPRAEAAGFEPLSPCHGSLFPHQADVCRWAMRGGRRAIFANFGLGKTRMHLQLAKWIVEKTSGRYLIVAPLGVRQEFTLSDGPEMGLEVQYVRNDADVRGATSQVLITNYERVRDGDISLSQFAGVSVTGGSTGGHNFLLSGYDSQTGVIECINSWGPQWGVNGKFLMSYGGLERLFELGAVAASVKEIEQPTEN